MTTEYQVIARKWRPQRFADVVGQEHIIATLKNAIRQQRTAHAYLFVGPRGIGKTTTARIFAKALNCTAPVEGEPCCKCDSCVAIANESSIDVIEIDAASQNSVDNIRDLREEVMHVPVSSRYKIYIIDEVHMLSKQAWNALLKTVEEPPRHAKFIFATTEVHMVLPTIISRCQRFDLQRLPTRLIADRLSEISVTEKVNISRSAIEAIARAADGGMRDAQSLLDQMIAFFGSSGSEQISEEQVLSLFGLTAASEIENLVRALFNNDRGGVVGNIFSLATRGKNLETLFNDLLEFLRGIQLSQILANPETVLEASTESLGIFHELANLVPPDKVQRLLETLAPVGRTLHDALNKQVYLETIILKAMRYAHSLQVDDLIARLNQIRNAGELEIMEKLPSVAAVPPLPPKTVFAPMAETVLRSSLPTPAPAPVSVPIEKPIVAEAPVVIPPAPKVEIPVEVPVVAAMVTEAAPELAPEPLAAVVEPTLVVVAPVVEEALVQQKEVPVVAEVVIAEEPLEEPETVKEMPVHATAVAIPGSKGGAVYDVDQYFEDVPVFEHLPEDEDTAEESLDAGFDTNSGGGDVAPVILPRREVAAEEAVVNETHTAAVDLWQKMVQAAEDRQLLNSSQRYYMREATPETWAFSALTIAFDANHEQVHAEELGKELKPLQQLLVEISGDWSAVVRIETRSGLQKSPPDESVKTSRLPEDMRQAAEANPYVQTVLDLFTGEIVDVHG